MMKKFWANVLMIIYSIRYAVPFGVLHTIAENESSWNPDIGMHPDGVSYGLMGLKFSGGSVADYQQVHPSAPSFHSVQKSLAKQIRIAAWFFGKRIPQLFQDEVGRKPTIRDVFGSYNMGVRGYSRKMGAKPDYKNQYATKSLKVREKLMKRFFIKLFLLITVTGGIILTLKVYFHSFWLRMFGKWFKRRRSKRG